MEVLWPGRPSKDSLRDRRAIQQIDPVMVSTIVLAAGSSQRMGGYNKLLLTWKNKTLIQHAVEVCMECCADEVLVVLGYQSLRIKDVLKPLPVRLVENPLFEQGMLTSIQAGIRGTSPDSAGWMIYLGDQPRISVSILNQLIEQFRKNHCLNKDLIVLPVCGGIRRNPVIFSRSFRERLLSHQGEGGRALIDSHEGSVLVVAVKDEKNFKDIDTPEEYQLLPK